MNVPSTPHDDDVDQVLGDAGRWWRAAQPEPTQPDAGLFAAGRAPAGASWASRRWAPPAAIVGLAAVVAAVVVPLSLQRPTEPQRVHPGPTPHRTIATQPPDHGSGRPVEGVGRLIRYGDGPIVLCTDVMLAATGRAFRGSEPGAALGATEQGAHPVTEGCFGVGVSTTGVDLAVLDTDMRGNAVSGFVRVEGTYHDGTVAVNRVVAAEPDASFGWVEPSTPCPAPAGGWPRGDGIPGKDAAHARDLLERIVAFTRKHGDRYTEAWISRPYGYGPSERAEPLEKYDAETTTVIVVGAKGDVEQARATLSAMYPGNLCVHKVKYATADLKRIEEQLSAIKTIPIEAHLDAMSNIVRVNVVALDPPTVAILEDLDQDAVAVYPLLRWLD